MGYAKVVHGTSSTTIRINNALLVYLHVVLVHLSLFVLLVNQLNMLFSPTAHALTSARIMIPSGIQTLTNVLQRPTLLFSP
jgi:ABC-type phosphate transport system permease subunit